MAGRQPRAPKTKTRIKLKNLKKLKEKELAIYRQEKPSPANSCTFHHHHTPEQKRPRSANEPKRDMAGAKRKQPGRKVSVGTQQEQLLPTSNWWYLDKQDFSHHCRQRCLST
jgi:hypothetical protein